MSQGAKPTHQSRSRKTRDKLLNALEHLLKEKDFGNISVAEIAAKAGVSSASIYRRFDKKEGFIPVLFDLYIERLNEWAASPEAQLDIEGLSLREALQALTSTAWRQIVEHAHMMRAIHLHGRNNKIGMFEKLAAFEESTLTGIKALIGHYSAEIKRPASDTTAQMLAYYLNNIMLERGLFGQKGACFGLTLQDTEFTNEIADFAYGYLTLEPLAS